MKNKVKPTRLQKKTLEIKQANPDMRISEAMIKAGYTPKSAERPKQNFVDRRGTQIAISEWRDKLRGLGLTDEILAKKHLEWLFAKKTITSLTEPDKQVPDYQTQLKAGEMLRKDFGLSTTETPDNLKRRIVAEEFFV